MYNLKIEDYCHACREFDPEVVENTPEIVTLNGVEYSEPVWDVVCTKRKRCKRIVLYLEKQLNKTV